MSKEKKTSVNPQSEKNVKHEEVIITSKKEKREKLISKKWRKDFFCKVNW